MRGLLFMAAILAFIGRLFGAEPVQKSPTSKAEVYAGLRTRAFQLKPGDLGESDFDKPLAVVMETAYEAGVATVVAVCDGSASIYFSNGGGIIGAGAQPQGKAASLALMTEAAKHNVHLSATKSTPLPKLGDTTFYVVTGKGVFTASAREELFGNNQHKLSPLFHKAHELISVIRFIDASRTSEGAKDSSPKKS